MGDYKNSKSLGSVEHSNVALAVAIF